MPFQVIPRELAFFDLLERAADGVASGAKELRALADELGAEAEPGERTRRIRELEHEGDLLTHRIIALVNTTFVTPVDREDLYALASALDDVLDAEHAVADLLVLYRITEPFLQFRQQADVLVGATDAVGRAMRGLRTLTPSPRVMSEIVRFERDGDHVYRAGVAALFSGDYGAMDVLRWKDILEQMELAVDRCEDVANAIESITLKFA